MGDDSSHSYVGPPDIHDARVIEVRRDADTSSVLLHTYEGRRLRLEFFGVAEVRARQVEGMVLYALFEEADVVAPLRRFVFLNWYEKSDAALSVTAEGFRSVWEERPDG